jgi:hypothetical protein
MACAERKPDRQAVTMKLTRYPFFNGLAFLALYVVTYGGIDCMKAR